MIRALAAASLLALAASFSARAEERERVSGLPADLEGVGIDQKLDAQVPLDLTFRDETGKSVTLREVIDGKPTILNLVYYRCPMLCTLVLNGLVSSMRVLSFDAGKEYRVVTVSIDPKEGPEMAAAKKETYVAEYGRTGAAGGWRFLVGDEEPVRRLAETVGFRYTYDAETGLYAHASGIMVLTPEGHVARYFYGVEYAPRDLRLALIEASQSRIGTLADQVLLFCYQYDPETGHYGAATLNLIRAGGVLTVVALVGYLVFSLRREARRTRRSAA